MENRLYAVRGAVCCENSAESVSFHVPNMYRALIERNGIAEDDIVSVVFSVTDDLTVLNPATALRKAGLALSVPLFACAEPFIEKYLPRVIRVLVTFYGSKRPEAVYLNGAEVLRPDLAGSAGTARDRE